jgi:hypothetical protein
LKFGKTLLFLLQEKTSPDPQTYWNAEWSGLKSWAPDLSAKVLPDYGPNFALEQSRFSHRCAKLGSSERALFMEKA